MEVDATVALTAGHSRTRRCPPSRERRCLGGQSPLLVLHGPAVQKISVADTSLTSPNRRKALGGRGFPNKVAEPALSWLTMTIAGDVRCQPLSREETGIIEMTRAGTFSGSIMKVELGGLE